MLALGIGWFESHLGIRLDLLVGLLAMFGAWLLGCRAGVSLPAVYTVALVAFASSSDATPRLDGIAERQFWWDSVTRLAILIALAIVVGKLRQTRERADRLAYYDALTGLANRQALFERGAQELERCRRIQAPITAVFLDCDQFKEINDRRGHAEGDEVLRAVAAAIKPSCRTADLAARLGGDEFVVVAPEISPPAAQSLAKDLQRVLNAAMTAGKWPVTFSIGVATFVTAPKDMDELVNAADNLMYVVKHGSKNGIECRTFDAGTAGGAPLAPAVASRSRVTL